MEDVSEFDVGFSSSLLMTDKLFSSALSTSPPRRMKLVTRLFLMSNCSYLPVMTLCWSLANSGDVLILSESKMLYLPSTSSAPTSLPSLKIILLEIESSPSANEFQAFSRFLNIHKPSFFPFL